MQWDILFLDSNWMVHWSCGINTEGELGDGTTINRKEFIQVGTDFNWAQVSVSNSATTFAVKTNGTLWAWGHNGFYGNGTLTDSLVPIQIGIASNWKSISAGESHCLALKTNGTVWGWGFNNDGELGLGNNSQVSFPVQIGTGTNWRDVDSGYTHSTAIKNDGTLWACGQNIYGQLGIGTINSSNIFLQIGTATNGAKIDATEYYTIVLKTDGSLWSSGINYFGQLGIGSNINSTFLTPINCPELSVEQDYDKFPFLIFPNPATSELSILTSGYKVIKKIKILDFTGKSILEQSSDFHIVQVENLASGMYLLLMFSDEDKIFQQKFMKK